MMLENIGASWRAVVVGFTVVLGALSSGCGSESGKRTVRDCSAECPEGYCDEDTGVCTFAPAAPEGGAGGAGGADGVGGQAGEAGEQGEPAMPQGGAGGVSSAEGDEVAPSLAITSPGEGDVLGPDVSFDFEADEPVTYRCSLNDEELDDCEPGMTLEDLLSGQHTFSVVAIDEAGNESELVDVTFVVNRAPTIEDVADIVTPEDISTGALPFGVDDEDNSAEDLIVIKALVFKERAPRHWYDALALLQRTDLDWGYLIKRALAYDFGRVLSLLIYARSEDRAVPAEAIRRLFDAWSRS